MTRNLRARNAIPGTVGSGRGEEKTAGGDNVGRSAQGGGTYCVAVLAPDQICIRAALLFSGVICIIAIPRGDWQIPPPVCSDSVRLPSLDLRRRGDRATAAVSFLSCERLLRPSPLPLLWSLDMAGFTTPPVAASSPGCHRATALFVADDNDGVRMQPENKSGRVKPDLRLCARTRTRHDQGWRALQPIENVFS